MSLFSQAPGVGAVQEFTVDSNAVSAKHSRPSNVIVSTKSGTSAFHGSAYETHRNNAIGLARARTDFYTRPPKLIRNEFGANAGGPVVIPGLYDGRKRTFWFVNYEALHQVSATTQAYRVPTAAMRQGDFSALRDAQGRAITIYDPLTTDANGQRQPFAFQGRANVIDPARVSPVAKYLFDITPLPTVDVNPLVDTNWYGVQQTSRKVWTLTSRVDHRISDRDNIYGRISYMKDPSQQMRNMPFANRVAGWKYVLDGERSAAATWMHTFSPTFYNELIGGARYRIGGGYTGTSTSLNEDWFEKLGMPNPFGIRAWPQFTNTGLDNPGAYQVNAPGVDRANETYFTLDDNMTLIRGKHELQFGGHWRKDLMNVYPNDASASEFGFDTLATALYDPRSTPQNPIATPLTGQNMANMFLGYSTYTTRMLRGWYYLRGGEKALYFQDNFKATPRLTLNLGLRWEYWNSYRDKNNVLVGFDPASHSPVLGTNLETMYALRATIPSVVARYQALGINFKSYEDVGLPQNLTNSRPRNFGPRLGFAYRALDGARAFVVRGGYSLAYFNLDQNTFIDGFNSNTPLSATFTFNPNDATQSPDGLPNYNLRAVPRYVNGVNDSSAVNLNEPRGITRGSATANYFAPRLPDARIHGWNLMLEKEVMASTVARVRYVANRTTNLGQWYSYNNATPNYIWFATRREPLPTGEFANVARRPYDQNALGTVREFRNTGFASAQNFSFELERRYDRGYGFQLSYVLANVLGTAIASTVPEVNEFMPGAVPTDYDERNRFLNYRRDPAIPKHRVQWNWLMDLPFGKGRPLLGNAGGVLNQVVGGWQVAGIGTYRTNYFQLPTNNWNFTGEKVELYGYKYPIQDCRSVTNCAPGYLWWNGYIPPNQINSKDAQGRPNGYMGVPDNYKPAVTPINYQDPTSQFYNSNDVFVPLQNGTTQRIAFDTNLHPWRNQFLPGVGLLSLDASLFKNFRLRESLNARFAADFFNVMNTPGNPNTINADGMLVTRNSGQTPRTLQLSLRLDW
jgi:hypothetical protein